MQELCRDDIRGPTLPGMGTCGGGVAITFSAIWILDCRGAHGQPCIGYHQLQQLYLMLEAVPAPTADRI